MYNERKKRAEAIRARGSIARAIGSGALEQLQDITVSEALVLGLLNQGVRHYIGIFGHGTTDIGEVLRVYEEAGLVKTWNVRHETAAAHAATMHKILTGETPAVITSIGPGALQAFAGSLAAASNGVGVYHVYGDETTHNEGFNMQQVPKDEQALFLRLFGIMGEARALYEPWSVVDALRAGAVATSGSSWGKPFFMLAPMNVQPVTLRGFNLLEFPEKAAIARLLCGDDRAFTEAAALAKDSRRITIKIGSGARGCGGEIVELARLLDAAIVTGAGSQGIVPYAEPRNMTVGGSKGSLSGNYAMNEADLAIIIGARAVCQWDSSGTAWKKARGVINFNINPSHAYHYNRTVPLVGDAKLNLRKFIELLKREGFTPADGASPWAKELFAKKAEWESFKAKRYAVHAINDQAWKRAVLTQPVAIRIACAAADARGMVKVFDAGDVQANGFQIVEDERELQTFSDTGASYMGFAVSSVMAGALSGKRIMAFSGDGCFMMNPQVLIDAVEHHARGIIVLFDNRRMAAITGLQYAQYGREYKTNDAVEVDYAALANAVKGVKGIFGGYSTEELKRALEEAIAYDGLSLVHVPVYSGSDELGGMGVFGDWNVGNWCDRVQKEHHRLGL